MKILLISIGLFFLVSCKKKDINQVENSSKEQSFKSENMEIQYAYTILYVPDVAKTLEFYTKAFGFEQKFLTPEKDYGELVSGSTTLAFANLELGHSNFKKGFVPSSDQEKAFGIELAFTTEEVEKVIENAITHGAELFEAAVTKPWGQQVGYLRDMNGFIIEICTPINN